MPQLIITKGSNHFRDFSFSDKIITIGADETNDLCLPGEGVSRYHAAIIRIPSKNFQRDKGYFIRDLGSLNFTRVNGKITHRRLLEDEDIIEIAEFKLKYKKEGSIENKDEKIKRVIKREIPSIPKELGTIRLTRDGLKDHSHLSPKRRKILHDIENLLEESLPSRQSIETIMDLILRATDPDVQGYIGLVDKIGDITPYVHRWYTGRPKEIEDSVADQLLKGESYYSNLVIGAPLRIRKKEVIGVIYFEKGSSKGEFTDEDMYFLNRIAPLIANKTKEAYSENNESKERTTFEEIFDWPAEMGMIGKNKEIREIQKLINNIASSAVLIDTPVLILGETGTGKELVARAIHENSPCKDKPFETINCANLPENTAESELFGHEPGAFTDAKKQKKGKLEIANGGTVLLDEIGDLPLSVQGRLLRFLQEGEFTRMGGIQKIKPDVRIITATNKNLKEGIEDAEFREDLFYRINKISITIPSLRERREDIPLLAHFFLDKYVKKYYKNVKGISHGTMNFLWENYDWPGNVRELEGCIQGIIARIPEEREFIFWGDLPQNIREKFVASVARGGVKRLDEIKKKVEKLEIEKALIDSNWNKKRAAELLGISRPTLDAKIKEYGISIPKV